MNMFILTALPHALETFSLVKYVCPPPPSLFQIHFNIQTSDSI
jgi:hypothetical protein